jgi:hypothetical protein
MTPTPLQQDDIEGLRKLAAAAGGDAWEANAAFEADVWAADGDQVCRTFGSIGHQPEPIDAADRALYIAAANPATILALLDRLERAEAALAPFAAAYRPDGEHDAETRRFLDRNTITPPMTVGDFRRAYEATNGRAEAAAGTVPEGSITADEVTALAHKLIRGLTTELADCEDDEALNYCARGIGSLNAAIITSIKERAAAPPAAPSEPVAAHELVIQVDNLCSQIEESLYAFRDDAEARRKAQGAIDHAKQVAAPYRWNGATPPAQDAGKDASAIVSEPALVSALVECEAALAGVLWDYGLGQDEHARCNDLLERIRPLIAAHSGRTAE